MGSLYNTKLYNRYSSGVILIQEIRNRGETSSVRLTMNVECTARRTIVFYKHLHLSTVAAQMTGHCMHDVRV